MATPSCCWRVTWLWNTWAWSWDLHWNSATTLTNWNRPSSEGFQKIEAKSRQQISRLSPALPTSSHHRKHLKTDTKTWSFHKTLASQKFNLAYLKGSFVLMICEKIIKMPIICNIPDRLVAIEWDLFLHCERMGNWMLSPKKDPGGFQGCKKNLCLSRLWGNAHHSTTCPWLWPHDLSLWALLDSALEAVFEDKCLTLHYLENLNSFALWKGRKKIFSIPSYLKYCVITLEGRLLMKFQDPYCCSLKILYSVGGLGFLWTRSSLHRYRDFIPRSAPQIATWEDLITSQR